MFKNFILTSFNICYSPTLPVSKKSHLSLKLASFDFMTKNVTHGIAIFVAFYIVKIGKFGKKYEKMLTSDLMISMKNGHGDLEYFMYMS